jgi:hypothetical protein
MVTMETAEKIAETCNQIEECGQALVILKSKKKCETPMLSIYKNDEDDGIHLSVSRGHALIVVGQILENLNTEYASLNNTALKEANSKA